MIEVVVREVTQETPDVRRITLSHPDGALLPPFEAGAHIDVHLPNGMVRQYSLISDPVRSDAYQLGVLKEKGSRGGSQWLHETLATNDRLRVSPPRNLFPLIQPARRHILFAGGIGITPILSMVRHLAAKREDFEVYYSVRNGLDAAFYDDLASLAPKERVRLITGGREAARSIFLDALRAPSGGTHLYVCGPSGYIQAVFEIARQQGWPETQMHAEAFGALVSSHDEADEAFSVQLARTGKTIQVAENQTVLRALAAYGIEIPFSCEQGVCGTCLTGVIAGVPDHRDQYLTDEERDANDQFTPCCSRAKSPQLILDL